MGLKHDLYLSRKPLAGFLAIGLAWATYFAQMPVIKANVGASDGQYGTLVLLSAFGALAAMWLAPAAQRFLGTFAVPVGILALAGGMLWAGAAATLVALTCAMFLASAGSGVVDVLINARISEAEEDSGRALMNLNHALYSFAYAGGALLTGGLRSAEYGPVTVFSGLVCVLVLLAWAACGAKAHVHETGTGQPTQLPVKLVVLTGLIVMVAFLAEASTEGWSALHLERTLGGSPAEGAMGPALLGLTMGIGRLSGHGLSRLIEDTKLMLIAVLVSAGGIGIAGFAQTVPVALIGFAIGGLGISVVAPLALGLIGRTVPPETRLAAISRASVMGYGAFFFGPPLVGFIAQGFGLQVAFLTIGVLLCLTAAVLMPSLSRAVR